MSNPFPYNQTVCAFSPAIGNMSGNTLIVAAYSDGLSACQFQLEPSTSSTSQLTYSYNCIGDIQNVGTSTTALTFLANAGNQANYWQYFLQGSEAKNLWLLSFVPQASASNFTSACVSDGSLLDNFDSAVASIFYDPLAPSGDSNLFIGGANGNIYAATVTFPTIYDGAYASSLVNNGYSLVLLATGSLVLYSQTNEVLWSTSSYDQLISDGTVFSVNDNGTTVSANTGYYQTQMNSTGIFGVYMSGAVVPESIGMSNGTEYIVPGVSVDEALWSTETTGAQDSYALALGSNGTLSIISETTGDTLTTIYTGSGVSTNSVTLSSSSQLVSYEFTFSAPTYTRNVSNTTLSSSSSGQIQIAALYVSGQDTTYLVTGLETSIYGYGLYEFTAAGGVGCLTDSGGIASSGVPGAPANTVAIAVSGTTVYVATATQVHMTTLTASGEWSGTWTCIMTTTQQTITSLSFSTVNNADFPQGALFIGSYATNNGGDSGTGSIFVYNVATNTTFGLFVNTIYGAVYGLCADPNGHVLANCGASGLAFYNLVPSGNFSTVGFQLIDNSGTALAQEPDGWLALVVSVAALGFAVATFDPALVGVALDVEITGGVLAAGGVAVAADGTAGAVSSNNQSGTTPTDNAGTG